MQVIKLYFIWKQNHYKFILIFIRPSDNNILYNFVVLTISRLIRLLQETGLCEYLLQSNKEKWYI